MAPNYVTLERLEDGVVVELERAQADYLLTGGNMAPEGFESEWRELGGDEDVPLSELKAPALREIAAALGLELPGNASKAKLLEAIEAKHAELQEPDDDGDGEPDDGDSQPDGEQPEGEPEGEGDGSEPEPDGEGEEPAPDADAA